MSIRLVSISFLLAWTASAWAEPSEAFIPSEGVGAIEKAWSERKAALQEGDTRRVWQAETDLLHLLRELDVRESEPLAAAVASESRRLAGADPREAARRAAWAVSLAPSMPQAHLTLARARFGVAPLEVGGWVAPLRDALLLTVQSPRHGSAHLANAIHSLLAAALLAGVLLLLVTVTRRWRVALHDFGHLLPGQPPVGWTALVAGAAALLLLVLSGSLALSFAILLAFLWLHLSRGERGVFASVLLLAGIAPFLLGWAHERIAWVETGASLIDGVEGRGDFSRIDELRDWAADPLAPPEAIFALARNEKREGRNRVAMELYERALRSRPDWPAALVNQANLAFSEGDLDAAREGYERAVSLDPELAEGWFGLSRIHYRNVDLVEGQRARERAISLSPGLVDRYTLGEEELSKGSRYLVDASLTPRQLQGLQGRKGEGMRDWAAGALWGFPAETSLFLSLGIVALLLAVIPAGRSLSVSRGCAACGGAVCWRCDRQASEICGPCTQVRSGRAGLDPSFRVRKQVEADRFERRREALERVGSYLLLGPFLRGRVAAGWIVATAGCSLLLLALGGPYRPVAGEWPLALRLGVVVPPLLLILLFSRASGGRED